MIEPTPFRVEVPDAKLADIRERVQRYRPFPAPVDEGDDWRYGINSRWLERLRDHWLNRFDWRAAEAELNRYPQYRVEIDGVSLHYAEVRGEGARRPLLLLHGWPGSHYEFWKIADRLAFPSRHGGSTEDAFDLIIASLPGYGFSGPTPRPLGMRSGARLLNSLMVDVLGHDRYMVQGGDWGSVAAAWLGIDHSVHCVAVHVNMIGLRPSPGNDGAATEDEREALRAIADRERPELAYAVQQSTRPQTLAIGLMDSPVGTAAWIIDKFHDWSDLGGGSIEDVYSLDELLVNVMIYLVNDTICTSLWSYRGMVEERVPFGPDVYCASPTAVARYPYERVGATPPRSWVERYYNVVRWTDADRGGHFAALEHPDSLLADVTAFARDVFPVAV